MRRLLATAAATALFGLSSASAQPPPGAGPSPEMRAWHEAHEKQRAQDLRTVLRLRPDQDAALVAFLQAARPPQMGDRKGPPPSPSVALSTPQRLDEMAKHEAEHGAERQRRADALRAFYAVLTPDQRPVFDALMRLQGPPRGPGGPHGAHGPGKGGFGWRGGPPPEGPPPGA